jgi:hypothetical protein
MGVSPFEIEPLHLFRPTPCRSLLVVYKVLSTLTYLDLKMTIRLDFDQNVFVVINYKPTGLGNYLHVHLFRPRTRTSTGWVDPPCGDLKASRRRY